MRAVSLLYHDVVVGGKFSASGFAGADAKRYKLDAEEFRRHIQAIARSIPEPPVTVLNLDHNTVRAQSLPVLFTFDDGGSSAYSCVAGMLDGLGWKAHFFITTDYIGVPGFMSREQISSLWRRGHAIGSHSCSHPARMSACSWDQLVSEWGRSARVLSEIVGEPVRIGSVPGGHYSRTVARAAAAGGIETLFTSEPTTRSHRVDGCLVLGRYTVMQGIPPAMVVSFATGRRSACWRQYVYWNVKKIGKAIGGNVYLRLRKSILMRN